MPIIVWENDFGYAGNKQASLPRGDEAFPNMRSLTCTSTLPKVTSKIRISARDKLTLREAKFEKNKVNKDISLATGLHITTISKILSRNTQSTKCIYFTPTTIKKIAKYLGVLDKIQCL